MDFPTVCPQFCFIPHLLERRSSYTVGVRSNPGRGRTYVPAIWDQSYPQANKGYARQEFGITTDLLLCLKHMQNVGFPNTPL